MSHLLTLSRAARLVGTTRAHLQALIKRGELATFEGMVTPQDLLQRFPKARLEDDTLFERLARIKETAFANRIRERLLPDPEVLVARLADLGIELDDARREVARYRAAVEAADLLLSGHESPSDPLAMLARQLRLQLLELIDTAAIDEDAQRLLAMDQVMRVVSAHVRLLPSGHEFLLDGTDTILEAALRAGLSLNYGCSSGNCGLCKARIVSGQAKKVRPHDFLLTEAEKNAGYTLLCSYTAVNDVVVEAIEAGGATDIPHQRIPARVRRIDAPAPDIRLLHLQTPRTQRLRFLAGQSVSLLSANGAAAEMPIASCPCDDRNIEFHVRENPDDPFAAQVFDGLRSGETITLDGPTGDFVLDDDVRRPVMFLACDTGFAPVKSLIEHALARESAESLHLYWFTCSRTGPYLDNVCRAWTDALDHFSYHPLILPCHAMSELSADGVRGMLESITPSLPTLAEAEVYLSGPTTFTETAAKMLAPHLPDGRLHVQSIRR
ncbi:MAG: 2Fe-2S iron-sulfur cluster-binding protein [Pseudomonadota bacterium]